MPAHPSSGARATVQHVEVDVEHAGQRIDNFLLRRLKGVPKTHIYRLLRKGEVRINKGRCGADYRLKAGDIVRIPPVRTASGQGEKLAAQLDGGQKFIWLEQRILYEDDHFLAINKPAGMATHGGSGISVGLIEALRLIRPHSRYLELVHRLDRDTSGCLLIAKRRSALTALHALLREEGLDKRYLALLRGAWSGRARSVNVALEKIQHGSGERVVNVSAAGKASHSRFVPQRRFKTCTLAEIRLFTGRTHQARVHAVHIGHPIAGDDKYGDRDFNRIMRTHGVDRLFLHAYSLCFRHPAQGNRVEICAPLPDDLQTALERIHEAAL